jgi:DNA polymerase III delta prime subunit
VVKEKIKAFAQKSVCLDQNRHKIVFLDEADGMPTRTQQVLVKAMDVSK